MRSRVWVATIWIGVLLIAAAACEEDEPAVNEVTSGDGGDAGRGGGEGLGGDAGRSGGETVEALGGAGGSESQVGSGGTLSGAPSWPMAGAGMGGEGPIATECDGLGGDGPADFALPTGCLDSAGQYVPDRYYVVPATEQQQAQLCFCRVDGEVECRGRVAGCNVLNQVARGVQARAKYCESDKECGVALTPGSEFCASCRQYFSATQCGLLDGLPELEALYGALECASDFPACACDAREPVKAFCDGYGQCAGLAKDETPCMRGLRKYAPGHVEENCICQSNGEWSCKEVDCEVADAQRMDLYDRVKACDPEAGSDQCNARVYFHDGSCGSCARSVTPEGASLWEQEHAAIGEAMSLADCDADAVWCAPCPSVFSSTCDPSGVCVDWLKPSPP